jgi:hypothetical protein
MLLKCVMAGWCLLGGMAAAGYAADAPAWPENLYPQGGFEAPPGENLPAGLNPWTNSRDEPPARVYITDEVRAAGGYSLCIERLATRGLQRVGLPEIAVEPGRRMLFSMLARCTLGQVEVVISFRGDDGKPISFERADAKASTPGTEVIRWGLQMRRVLAPDPDGFNRAEVALTVPPGARTMGIQIGYSNHPAGQKAWFDEVQVIPLSSD